MGGHENGDVASRIVVEEFARLADEGYDPTRGAEVVAATLEACQRRIAEYAAAGGPAPRRTPGHHRGRRPARRGRRRPGVAAGQPRRLADLRRHAAASCARSAPTTASCRSWSTPAQISPAEAAEHPERHVITRALGGPRLEPADYFVLPVERGRAAAAVQRRRQRAGRRRRRSPRILAEHPGPARRRRPAGRRRAATPEATTTRPRSSSMWWDWSPIRPTTPSDSERVSSRNWEHCRDRTPATPCAPTGPATGSASSASAPS